jgi:prepilin-type N-terminal cleavage/methylation domain-containing protein
LRLPCPNCRSARSGFTLIEALVALALILAFVSVIAPTLFQSRRIMADAQSRLAGHIVLRSVLTAPVDRMNMMTTPLVGEIEGIRWQLSIEPIEHPALVPQKTDPRSRSDEKPAAEWGAFRVAASVWWGPDRVIRAQTIRLGKVQ